MRLAAHLGMTVNELLDRMSSSELSEWMAFEREYGIPDVYFLVAKLAPAILAPYAKESMKAGDFVPYFAEPQPPQTVADHKAMFRAMARKKDI